MTKIATLETVINEVHQQSANHFDEIVPVNDMQFDSLTRMWISGRPIEVAPTAQRLLANRLRVPFSYLSRCPDELQARNLNYWIEQERRTRDSFFCRFDANRLRAVFTNRYTAIDHMEVLTKILEAEFDPAREIQFALDDEILVLKMPEYDKAFHLAGEDKIIPGISIANSEVGIVAVSIEAFYYRLVCTNGLISQTAMDARYKHISRRVMDEFPDILQGVVSQSHRGHDQFRMSTQSPVHHPESTIDSFARQFQISQEEAQIVKQAFYLEQGGTMFHIIQAFTRAAQDGRLTASGAYRLERVGGQILNMVKA